MDQSLSIQTERTLQFKGECSVRFSSYAGIISVSNSDRSESVVIKTSDEAIKKAISDYIRQVRFCGEKEEGRKTLEWLDKLIFDATDTNRHIFKEHPDLSDEVVAIT